MSDEPHPLVMFEDNLWWNFERYCRLHGYVMTPITGTATVYVHKPGSPDQPVAEQPRDTPFGVIHEEEIDSP